VVPTFRTAVLVAFFLELLPAAAFALASDRLRRIVQNWPFPLRVAVPAVFAVPYLIVAASNGTLRWEWLLLYISLPVAMVWLLDRAAYVDPSQRGNWRDAIILLILGVSVDLRWFDSAWPNGLRGFGNLLLVDMGLYGFLAIRGLDGTGFDGAIGRLACGNSRCSLRSCSDWA
jgi:uncharacterized protein